MAVTGRPRKELTPEVQALICQAIREGNYREVAAVWAGVSIRTFRRWCRQGKGEREGVYHDFWHAILEAERGAEITMVGVVLAAAKEDPRHAQWWLERKFPDRWGNNTRELRALSKQIEKLAARRGASRGRGKAAAAGAKAGGTGRAGVE